jgi:V/A-type H+-transporting ATPase subunit B
MIREYKTIEEVSEQLVLATRIDGVGLDELGEVKLSDQSIRPCRVVEINGGDVLLQLLDSADGISPSDSRVRFTSHGVQLAVSPHMLGRIFNGSGKLTDGGVRLIPDMTLNINGTPINPVARLCPDEIITTGLSAIDGLSPLAKGQKLPIISGAGLPHTELAAFLAANARIGGDDSKKPAVVFAAIGMTAEDAERFVSEIKKSGAIDRSVLFMNLVSDPRAERILTPRVALTAAEYLAFERDMDVLVIMADMLGYADALCELSTARGKLPLGLGYSGYLYSELASVCERAGRRMGSDGSITLVPILSLPSDDPSRPLPDIMKQITEGHVTLSRELLNDSRIPPVDPLSSVSRYMNRVIGEGKTEEDHAALSNELLDRYVRGKKAAAMAAGQGEEALTALERAYVSFADEFEKNYIGQGFGTVRSTEETLGLGRALLEKYFPKN